MKYYTRLMEMAGIKPKLIVESISNTKLAQQLGTDNQDALLSQYTKLQQLQADGKELSASEREQMDLLQQELGNQGKRSYRTQNDNTEGNYGVNNVDINEVDEVEVETPRQTNRKELRDFSARLKKMDDRKDQTTALSAAEAYLRKIDPSYAKKQRPVKEDTTTAAVSPVATPMRTMRQPFASATDKGNNPATQASIKSGYTRIDPEALQQSIADLKDDRDNGLDGKKMEMLKTAIADLMADLPNVSSPAEKKEIEEYLYQKVVKEAGLKYKSHPRGSRASVASTK